MAVLFVTGLGREIERAENLMELYRAYHGEKKIISLADHDYEKEITSGKYSLRVMDIFPTEHRLPTIMVWHAIQGGKHIGLDEKATYYRREYAPYMDAVISAGHGGAEMWKQCTGVPDDRILTLGMPRTDRYIGKKNVDSRKIYLYVPTFRFKWEPVIPVTDWDKLDRSLNDDELLIIKSHPHGKQITFKNFRHIIEADRMKPTVDYLYDCDVVITDYSSVIFDGFLLGKPAVLYEKTPGYVAARGMYMKYPWQYTDSFATNDAALLETVRCRASHPGLSETEKKCMEYVADMCDGKSCERICRLIDEMR